MTTNIDSWGTASISGTIANTGAIEVHDGALTLFGSLSGSGSVTVDADATLDVNATVSQTITFGGDGAELQIDTSGFGGSVAGFAATDKLDLSTIKYDGGTSATYDAATGNLVVSDAYGHTITVNLVGADYSNAHFAGGSDGHGGTLVTLNAVDDAPHFAGSPVAQSTSFSELENTTGSPTADPAPAATGTIAFSDVDLTERPTATVAITDQTVTWLDADHATHLTLTAGETAALEQALTLQTTGHNNGTVGWSYSIADNALDFLGEGQTAKVVSTLTLDDHQGKTDTAEVTVTITGKNDAPAITAETNDHSGADLSETNAGLAKQGTLTVSDADATDHVTVAVDHLDIYLDGVLQTDYVGEPSSATLLNYLSVQSGDILNGTATHSQFTWDFNSGSEAFDFLAAGHTLSLQYTIVPDDGHAPTGTGNGVITINIAGSNDAPTLDNATLGPVAGNDSNPGGSTVSDLFAGKFHDADDGASLKAIAVTSDAAAAAEGVWQYEVAGTHQWVDIGSVSDTQALVLGTDALVRFVPADGYTGTPDPLGVHALDDTYTGGITNSALTATTDITAMSTDGTAPVSDTAATIGTSVTAPDGGPVIDTTHLRVSHNGEFNTDTVTHLSVVDTDAGASTDAFTVTAVTAHAPDSSVDLSPASGSLDDINTALQHGITYNPGETPPDTDQITLTVTDTTTGLHDTVNFIFDEAGDTSQGITLQGTSGKDVIFAPTTGDTLTGGGGKDQFVFAPGSSRGRRHPHHHRFRNGRQNRPAAVLGCQLHQQSRHHAAVRRHAGHVAAPDHPVRERRGHGARIVAAEERDGNSPGQRFHLPHHLINRAVAGGWPAGDPRAS